jgi:hypothetical protein
MGVGCGSAVVSAQFHRLVLSSHLIAHRFFTILDDNKRQQPVPLKVTDDSQDPSGIFVADRAHHLKPSDDHVPFRSLFYAAVQREDGTYYAIDIIIRFID